MPVVRIRDATWDRLKKWAEPLEDSADDAIRRVLDVAEHHLHDSMAAAPPPMALPDHKPDDKNERNREEGAMQTSRTMLGKFPQPRRLSGKKLKQQWDIPARQVLAHRDGTFFEVPTNFPCALCDADGYLLFETEPALRNSSYLKIGKKLNVPGGIHRIPGYLRQH